MASAGKVRYVGTVRHGVDDKRRLQIPARWRPADPNDGLHMVIWPKHKAGVCLRVLPESTLEAIEAQIESLPKDDPEKNELRVQLKWLIMGNAETVSPDKAGRVCIPEAFAKAAGIEHDVVMVGLSDRFEIWSPDRHQTAYNDYQNYADEALKLLE